MVLLSQFFYPKKFFRPRITFAIFWPKKFLGSKNCESNTIYVQSNWNWLGLTWTSLGNILSYNMLRTYSIVSKQLDILHSCSLIKVLQILLVLITLSILTATGYKFISLGLLVICFSLIIYIIASEFLKLRTLYSDLKIACSLQDPSSSSPSSS